LHLVPLPPGVPYEEQQLAALDWGPTGDRMLHLTDEEYADLATSVRQALAEQH
jgi:hypothetical protein